jgi:hypothetical protein
MENDERPPGRITTNKQLAVDRIKRLLVAGVSGTRQAGYEEHQQQSFWGIGPAPSEPSHERASFEVFDRETEMMKAESS